MSIVYFIDWVHFLVRVDHYYVPRPLKIKVSFFFGWRRPSVRLYDYLSVRRHDRCDNWPWKCAVSFGGQGGMQLATGC
jgi:hypothetical protein